MNYTQICKIDYVNCSNDINCVPHTTYTLFCHPYISIMILIICSVVTYYVIKAEKKK